jgi:hypothetical protein
MEQNPSVRSSHQFLSLYFTFFWESLKLDSCFIRNEVFHFAQAKENIYFPSLLISAAQLLLSSLSVSWTCTVVSDKRNAVEERRKIMETKEKELNLPISFLRSFQDDYFDPNGKQSLQYSV